MSTDMQLSLFHYWIDQSIFFLHLQIFRIMRISMPHYNWNTQKHFTQHSIASLVFVAHSLRSFSGCLCNNLFWFNLKFDKWRTVRFRRLWNFQWWSETWICWQLRLINVVVQRHERSFKRLWEAWVQHVIYSVFRRRFCSFSHLINMVLPHSSLICSELICQRPQTRHHCSMNPCCVSSVISNHYGLSNGKI